MSFLPWIHLHKWAQSRPIQSVLLFKQLRVVSLRPQRNKYFSLLRTEYECERNWFGNDDISTHPTEFRDARNPGFQDQGRVSQKSRNFSSLFRVPQFPLYLRNAAVLSHPTSPLGFSYIKSMLKDKLFKTGRLKLDNWPFGPEKFSGLWRNRPQPSQVPALLWQGVVASGVSGAGFLRKKQIEGTQTLEHWICRLTWKKRDEE